MLEDFQHKCRTLWVPKYVNFILDQCIRVGSQCRENIAMVPYPE